MIFDKTLIQPCGGHWCVKTPSGIEGPLETFDDANAYVMLLTLIKAARFEHSIEEKDAG